MSLQNRERVELTKQIVGYIWQIAKSYNYNVIWFSDLVDFTDEEGYGKYLDLHESYVKYTNLKGIQVSL
jgi:hypothetical protein